MKALVTACSSALLVLVLLVAPAAADRDYLVHKVKEGDTLGLLAAEYYGDRNHAVFIMVANKLVHPRPLKKGEKLRIPVSRDVTVAVGDNWESLAENYLGDKRRGRYLAEFNGGSPESSLAAGLVISVPFHVTHTAATDESLTSISLAYFGDSGNAGMLRGYNFLEADTLPKGQTLVIPIHHVKVRDSVMPPIDEESKARTEKRRAMIEAVSDKLPRALVAWRRGGYGEVKRELIEIDLDFLDADRAAAIGTLLGAAYVALGDEDSAVATFRRVIERAPKTALSPYRYSPRIQAVWKKAGGA
ncbi:MAG TPA: LysM peptidoglycan-binding domain-containing protein [Kofleriaceae bacterium]|nr:LysM peptidoglycan-binding domain-containing protein [Kofleriaceae bacterium]